MLLYHFVPQDMQGTIIYPLNQLLQLKPELSARHMAKYQNLREKDVYIADFGYWNDCINLVAVNPGIVKSELEAQGHTTEWSWKFYEIDSDRLDQSKMIVMIPTDADDASMRRFVPFTTMGDLDITRFTDIARARYQKAKINGLQPFTFGGLPHVLYKDSINIRDVRVVEFT